MEKRSVLRTQINHLLDRFEELARAEAQAELKADFMNLITGKPAGKMRPARPAPSRAKASAGDAEKISGSLLAHIKANPDQTITVP